MAAEKGNKYSEIYTPEIIQKIIDDLLDYAQNSDSIYLATFSWIKYKKSKKWLYDLCRSHPELEEAMELARELIAKKLADHSWIGDRNSAFGEKLLPMYSKEYKELLKWKAEISKEQPRKEDSKPAFNQWMENQKES